MKNHFSGKAFLFLASIFFFSLHFSLQGQNLKAGPQVLTFHSDIDDTEQPYAIYLPQNFDADQEYPFVVMLHGAGSNHRLGLRRVFGKSNAEGETDVEASRYFPQWKNRDYIVASTFARGTMGYQGIAEKDVMDMITDVKERFRINENRTYLTGLSMGGGGTLWLGLSYPDMWAAIAPVCPAPPAGTELLAGNALNFPVQLHQGGADPVVRPEGTRAWHENLKKNGVEVTYTEYPGVQHDSWVNAYENGQIFDWFDKVERNPHPTQVKYVTSSYRHDKAYWITVNAITAGKAAKIDAQFTGLNQLSIKSSNLEGFTLDLEGHPKFSLRKGLALNIDGKVIKAKTRDGVVSFRKKGKRWVVGQNDEEEVFTKRQQQEGPMTAAIQERHVYVYGTEGNPSEAEQSRRKAQAEKAANWSFYRGEFLGRIMVFPRVLSDKQVRPSDLEGSNLVLFGDKNTNAAIAQISDQLPFEFSAPAEEAGLAYIFPNGNHYVLINSGLSIFDAPESDKQIDGLARFAAPAILFALMKFDDYVVFDKEKVYANGFFDNHWKLDSKAQEVLNKSGKVKVK